MKADRRLEDIVVGPGASLRDALQALDRGGLEIAFLVRDGRLEGALTDGDVRRALLAGASLEDDVAPYATTTYTAASPTDDRAFVLDLMQARGISQVPVVDGDGSLVALHVLRDLIGGTSLDLVAVVLAGGVGSRLRPYTDSVPKPMLRVAGRPLLERLVLHLVGEGVREVVLAVNYRSDVVESHFGDGERFGCEISYLREAPEQPLGTAGCLAQIAGRLDGRPTLAVNGDLLVQFSVHEMLATHQTAGAWTTVGMRTYPHTVPFGVLEHEDGVLSAISEKPTSTWSVAAGIYLLDPEAVAQVRPGQRLDMPELIDTGLRQGRTITVHDIGGSWIDVGRPEDLSRARGQL